MIPRHFPLGQPMARRRHISSAKAKDAIGVKTAGEPRPDDGVVVRRSTIREAGPMLGTVAGTPYCLLETLRTWVVEFVGRWGHAGRQQLAPALQGLMHAYLPILGSHFI